MTQVGLARERDESSTNYHNIASINPSERKPDASSKHHEALMGLEVLMGLIREIGRTARVIKPSRPLAQSKMRLAM